MTAAAKGGPEIVLDLSRLLSRVLHATPTGVDRCEMAYARGLLAAVPDRIHFAAVHPFGIYGRLPRAAVERFLDLIAARWENGGIGSRWEVRRFAIKALTELYPRLPARRNGRDTIYLQASPNNLDDMQSMARILRREGARFVCLLHDLIPLQYPEYARPDGAALHARRIETIVALASGVVTNSQATLDAVEPYFARAAHRPQIALAHLGTEIGAIGAMPASDRPYFISIGTIEPRKNHLLLLNLWRQMAEQHGAANIPRLLVVGRRGWENEQVVDMLERCPSLVGCVEELSGLPDSQAQALLCGARALLLPSFAEGYGMPVAEAIARHVPVVCSDLPALREAGGDVPLFLDPLDGPAWARVINALATDGSLEAEAQAERRRAWKAPTWSEHIAIVLDLLHRVAA